MKQGKKSHMTPERIQNLDAVGFCWDTHEATWRERLQELAAFKQETGHCSVPTNLAANPKLATWVHHQRRQWKKFKEGKAAHITAERIAQLDALGFDWTPRAEKTSPLVGEASGSSPGAKQPRRAAAEEPDAFNARKPFKRAKRVIDV